MRPPTCPTGLRLSAIQSSPTSSIRSRGFSTTRRLPSRAYATVSTTQTTSKTPQTPPSSSTTTTATSPAHPSIPQVTQTLNAPSLPFSYGTYGSSALAAQPASLHHIRLPILSTLTAERNFRKLHHAVALRWLGMNGYNNEGAGGHMTVRDPIRPDCFWINPHGKSFSLMRPEDLVLVNEEGVVQDGEGGNMHSANPAGYVIHSAIHKRRPDVVGVVHCHSVPSKAFSSLGIHLGMINQDACRFYQDHGVAPFGGIALSKHEEGEHIADALGQGKACILQNHGHLTVAKTADAAAFLFGAFDRCIQAQLMADAAAAGRRSRGEKEGTETIEVSDEVATYTRDAYNDEKAYIMFQSAFEDVVRASGGELTMRVEGELPRE